METLWAPWRIKFIEELHGKSSGCVFCELALKNGDDEKKLVLHRGKHCFVVMNKYPYNSGHLLVLPYRHVGEISELSQEERLEMMDLSILSIEVLKKAFNVEGFNCGMNLGKVAGAGIADHVHQHIVPRWMGDSNFMPVIGETRSIPEYLEDTYKKLVVLFKKI